MAIKLCLTHPSRADVITNEVERLLGELQEEDGGVYNALTISVVLKSRAFICVWVDWPTTK